jgi:hypothetical protein
MIASDTLIQATGWKEFDIADKDDNNQERLDFSHSVASLFTSIDGKKLLDVFVKQFLLNNIVSPNDTQFAVGIKQGRADVIKQILAHIEISNNAEIKTA